MEPFCTVCRSRIYEARIEAFSSVEEKYLQYFSHSLERRLQHLEQGARESIRAGDVTLEKSFPLPPSISHEDLNHSKLRLHIREINPILVLSGLSLYAPSDGDPLPILSTCQVSEQASLPDAVNEESSVDSGRKLHSTFWPTNFSANIMIRVWYLEYTGNKGELVGYVFLDDAVIIFSPSYIMKDSHFLH